MKRRGGRGELSITTSADAGQDPHEPTTLELDGRAPPSPGTGCRLWLTAGPDVDVEVAFEKGTVSIGTSSQNDLVLTDHACSRRHCELQRAKGAWLLVDLASTNGTWVNGRRVERVHLSPGSVVTLGTSSFVFAPFGDGIPSEPESSELPGVVTVSSRMRRVFALLRRVAPTELTVLLQGETGTGKDVAANALHTLGRRAGEPFVVVDCGALVPTLLESELFGHEKGAFTGATEARHGAFERAGRGTLFLDEIGELPLSLQPKLLRALESRTFRRVGGSELLSADVRVVAATNRDLAAEVEGGRFRKDLFFRLAAVQLQLPPLRRRLEDIPALARALLERAGEGAPKRLTRRALAALEAHPWPGNVRELGNVLRHAQALCDGPEIDVCHLPELKRLRRKTGDAPFERARERLMSSFEREYLVRLFARCQGNLARAAEESGLSIDALTALAQKHALAGPPAERRAAKGRP
ncbi:MAG: sigma 54-interacting transcriptional regulator [Deltaproteobacteria bacterium]